MQALRAVALRAGPWTLALAMLVPLAAQADDEEMLATTTEFGVTITPDDLYDAIQETQDFWPPVRAHLASDEFTVAELSLRREASAFIARVNDHLHDRLFGDDEAIALDLMDYLAARLRVFELYRQLREVLDDDALLVELKADWEQALRELNELPEDQRLIKARELASSLQTQMADHGLGGKRLDRAAAQWQRLAEAIHRMNTTGAGRQMLAFEGQVKAAEREQATVIRQVVAAADWSQITKSKTTSLGREDFLAAWQQLATLEEARTAKLPAAAPR